MEEERGRFVLGIEGSANKVGVGMYACMQG